MEEGLIKILKELKAIKPDEGFVKRSRQMILSAPQRKQNLLGIRINIFESFKLGAALTLASALLFIVFAGVSYLNNSGPALLADQHKAGNQSDFYIQLGEARYDLNKDKELGAKIEKLLEELH